ncbi:hypothetical protein EMIT013CA1_10529 [Bacillus sp. IT-13CA1]
MPKAIIKEIVSNVVICLTPFQPGMSKTSLSEQKLLCTMNIIH